MEQHVTAHYAYAVNDDTYFVETAGDAMKGVGFVNEMLDLIEVGMAKIPSENRALFWRCLPVNAKNTSVRSLHIRNCHYSILNRPR